jgi:3-methyladenine DNA glycosylase AlkC
MEALNAGLVETVVLVEWLAINQEQLAKRVLPSLGLEAEIEDIITEFAPYKGEGITRRIKAMGGILFRVLDGRPDRVTLFQKLASHPSDMVRAWAAYSVTAEHGLTLEERLKAARCFAADPAMSVRECAWDSFRPFIADELPRALKLLRPWVLDKDANIRRCAIEATRPRGVWTAHLAPLREQPERALPLLEPVRSDPSRYVQNAVANWLNDASKSNPEWVEKLCRRWEKESKTQETAYIVKRAMRTIRKS